MKAVVIAGGGLSGLSLGLALRKSGVPVEIREAGSYPRHRVCGEFISGVSSATLEKLGVRQAMSDAWLHDRVLWCREGRELLRAELPEPAWAISRWRLDERLRALFEAAGGVMRSGVREPRVAREGLVWAAGRIPSRSPWVGLKGHFLGLEMDGGLEMHLGSNGYVGLTPVEDGRVNVCGLFRVDRGISARGVEWLLAYLEAGGNASLVRRLRRAEADAASFSGVAGFQLGMQEAEEGMCAVGDAWGMIPPFTGNGMSMAFEGAELAVEPLVAWAEGRRGWREVVTEVRAAGQAKFRRRLRSALVMQRVLMHGCGQDFMESLAERGWLPFRPMLRMVR
jgi:flavin-dependent dehydrogenase